MQSTRRMTFARQGAVFSLSDIVLALGGIISNVIFARALGPQDVGQLSVFISVAAMAAPLASLGIGRANIYFLNSRQYSHNGTVSQTFRVGLVVGTVLLIAGTLLFHSAPWYFGSVPFWVLVAFASGMSCQTLVTMLRPVLLADLAPLKVVAVDHSQRTFILVASAMLWAAGELTLERSMGVTALASLISAAVVLHFLRHDLRSVHSFDWSWLRRTAAYGLQMAASGMLFTLTSSLSVLIIRSLLDDGFTQVGVYTRAVAVATMVVIVPRSLSLVFYAKWSLASNANKTVQIERAARFNVGYGCVAALLLLVVGKQMIWLMYGVEFIQASGPLQILAPAMVLQCLFSVLNSFLASEGRAGTTTLAMAGTLIVVTGASIALVPRWGIHGAATAVVLGNLFSASVLYAACHASHGISLRRMLLLQRSDIDYLLRSLR